MPIGTQTVTDSFDRADEDPMAGNWTSTTGTFHWKIVSNFATPASTADDCEAYYNAWVNGNDQYSQVGVALTASTTLSEGLGVCVRHASGGDTKTFYRLVVNSDGEYELAKMITASKTVLRTGTVTYVGGQKIGVSASGGASTTLRIWYNFVQIGTDVIDSSSPITTGFPGIVYSSTGSTLITNDWDAGTTILGMPGLFTI